MRKRSSQKPTDNLSAGLYYIRNAGVCGNSARWWCVDGHGYTSDLNKAWKVTKLKADSICRSRPMEDSAHLVDEMDKMAERHVDMQRLARTNQ